ncbi:SRPBCC family protein [Streptomyces sp. XM4193]|uniref:SRPBCC family protein n=1 Tax=Streptomyces sp. XM4193 TaxID=2929782 RepID=UPI001FFA391B|nr:SRPBCC family protein [Streptomyces sp. XM4193]MCK1796002.1 SRPBCC family protein [Streptomyces sp. XM4193]
MVTEEIEIAAGRDRVWEVVADVTRWPSVLESVNEVRAHQEGPPGPGCVYTLRQPGLPRTRWTITEWLPGKSFTWESRGPGARSVASHRLTATEAGGTRLTLVLEQSGPLNAVLGPLIRSRAVRLVRLEAAGLKAAAEA